MDGKVLNIEDILQILPHRYPFLLVDRIVSYEPGKKVVGIKNVTFNESFFQGHFPQHPVMPAVLILEAIAQVAAALLLLSVENRKDQIPYFLGVDRAKFRKPVIPGDQLRIEVEVVSLRSRTCKISGRVYVGEALVAEAKITSAMVDR